MREIIKPEVEPANGVRGDIPWHDIMEFRCFLVNCRAQNWPPEFDLPLWANYDADGHLTVTLQPLTAKEKREYLPSSFGDRVTLPVLSCAVGLYSCDTTSQVAINALWSAREWLLRCLRLLKAGFLWMTYRPLDHIFDWDVLCARMPAVELRRSDIENLRQLMTCIRNTGLGLREREIHSHKWIRRSVASGVEERRKARSLHLEVALSAFERANEYGPYYVDCLVDFIVALESLYLCESDELGYRLATRIATLLGKSPKSRAAIQDEIRNFYRDRSFLIHGTAKVLKSKYSVNRLREYVRRSLLYYIALEGLGKKSIIEELDRSLFKPLGARQLREMGRKFYGSKLAVALNL